MKPSDRLLAAHQQEDIEAMKTVEGKAPQEIELAPGQILKAEDGDVVIITADEPMTHDNAEALNRYMEQRLPRGVRFIVLDYGLKASILRGFEESDPMEDTL